MAVRTGSHLINLHLKSESSYQVLLVSGRIQVSSVSCRSNELELKPYYVSGIPETEIAVLVLNLINTIK